MDQITKFYVVETLILGESYKITNYLNIVHIQNRGLILGSFSWFNENILFLLHLTLFLLAIFIITKFIYSNIQLRNLSILFFSGAIGNSIDRILKGAVIDFIDIYYKNFHWPAFNFADLMISVGIIMYIFKIYFKDASIVHRNN